MTTLTDYQDKLTFCLNQIQQLESKRTELVETALKLQGAVEAMQALEAEPSEETE